MTLERWIHGVNRGGVQALIAKPHPGRPTQLTPAIKQQLAQHLGKAPQEFGLSGAAWDGPTLVVHLKEHFGVEVKVRQAQMWLHRLGYSLKRASYIYVQARAKDSRDFRRK
jgi:transposase